MAWRTIHISRPARLGIKQHNLCVSSEGTDVTIPLEDISCLIVDNKQTIITAPTLSALCKVGASILTTDEKHLPTCITSPTNSHWRMGETVNAQINWTKPFKKRLWQNIIRQKIRNQAYVLNSQGKLEAASALKNLISHVDSGDTKNIEARAAAKYWKSLFSDFIRSNEDDSRNAALNYTYAIIRSLIARQISATGFIPALGIKHHSVTNAFNLADDLIEPFRPTADGFVVGLGFDPKQNLTTDDRRNLVGIIETNTMFDDKIMTLPVAVELSVNTLAQASREHDVNLLKLPEHYTR